MLGLLDRADKVEEVGLLVLFQLGPEGRLAEEVVVVDDLLATGAEGAEGLGDVATDVDELVAVGNELGAEDLGECGLADAGDAGDDAVVEVVEDGPGLSVSGALYVEAEGLGERVGGEGGPGEEVSVEDAVEDLGGREPELDRLALDTGVAAEHGVEVVASEDLGGAADSVLEGRLVRGRQALRRDEDVAVRFEGGNLGSLLLSGGNQAGEPGVGIVLALDDGGTAVGAGTAEVDAAVGASSKRLDVDAPLGGEEVADDVLEVDRRERAEVVDGQSVRGRWWPEPPPSPPRWRRARADQGGVGGDELAAEGAGER